MLDALKRSLRRRALAKCAPVPTGIAPLKGLGSAVVLYDPVEEGSAEAAERLAAFLKDSGIAPELYPIEEGNLNFYGKTKKTAPQVPQTDLLISLVSGENFAEEYESRRSPARFKVGRRQLEGGLYDLVVAPPVWRETAPAEVVAEMEEILCKIK